MTIILLRHMRTVVQYKMRLTVKSLVLEASKPSSAVTTIYDIICGTQDAHGRESADISECQQRRNMRSDVTSWKIAGMESEFLLSFLLGRIDFYICW
jgi:uncharacterized protein (DUF2336 family)